MIDCIINVGYGHWYPRGSKRLANSLVHHGFPGAVKVWAGELPPDSPTHRESPYAMKVYAFKWAIEQGYQRILWLDSSIWCRKYPEVHMAAMARDGYYLLGNGDWKCDQWTNDACLEYFGLSRDEAREIPMLSSGVLGLDFSTETGREFFDQWEKSMLAGAFKGSWTATPSEGSGDRYRGHRHDQSCESIIAHRLGMIPHPEETFDAYYKPVLPETVEFAIQGM